MLSTLREHAASDGADANVSAGRPRPLADLSLMNTRKAWTDFDISKDHTSEASGHDEPDNWWSPATPEMRPHSTSVEVFARRDSPSVPWRYEKLEVFAAFHAARNQFTGTIVPPPQTPAGKPCVLSVPSDKIHCFFFFSFNAELGCKGSSMIDDMPSAYRALAEVIVGVSDR